MSYNAYATLQKAAESPRDLEIRAISFVTRQLTDANAAGADSMSRIRALNNNMRMWSLLVQDLSNPDNGLPEAIKGRYISLGLFARRFSLKALTDASDLGVLIRLNSDVLEALDYQRQALAA
ncbi:MAG: flagellar biosynthesis regulator FlaF [Janthinobacterium lividum]